MNAPSQIDPLPESIRLHDISRSFGTAVALHDISLSIIRGEIVGLIGRSGAGKSTLIRILNGLDKPQAGRVLIGGQDITDLDEQAL